MKFIDRATATEEMKRLFANDPKADGAEWREPDGKVYTGYRDGRIEEVTNKKQLILMHVESELGVKIPPNGLAGWAL